MSSEDLVLVFLSEVGRELLQHLPSASGKLQGVKPPAVCSGQARELEAGVQKKRGGL